jgi:16S rRNA processing protein RimM
LTDPAAKVSAGRVGRPHGLDGSFHVEAASEPLAEGAQVTVGGRPAVVERSSGTAERPLVRLSGVSDREAAGALRGERILVEAGDLEEGEYLAADLVGCEVPGIGRVRQVISAPSCDLLEVGEAKVLVPFIGDAVKRIDTERRVIEVDARFLDLPGEVPAE